MTPQKLLILLRCPGGISIAGPDTSVRTKPLILFSIPQRFRSALRALVRGISIRRRNVYRPEQHYMRGPGPKFRSKTNAR
jgi:hypothetical protein